jgi:hypothetical protein
MATAIQNLSQGQIMLSFAYLAYCGEEIVTANPQTQILNLIKAAMPQIPPIASPNPTWQVVWGPGVYTTPGALYQDNLMYVAQNQSDKSQFVIAVRGTNFVADLDWLMENFDVRQMMTWPPGSSLSTPAGAMMSESTSIGMQILLAMKWRSQFCDVADELPAHADDKRDQPLRHRAQPGRMPCRHAGVVLEGQPLDVGRLG